jgi:putative NADH-flavin reductase
VEHAVVLGATGRVGAAVVTFALEAGHRVTAVARNPAKVGVSHERLRVVQRDTQEGSYSASASSHCLNQNRPICAQKHPQRHEQSCNFA